MKITPEILRKVAPGANAGTLRVMAEAMTAQFPAAGINTPLRAGHFIGQWGYECQFFTVFVENLRYTTAGRLCQVWPSRFKTIKSALPYVKQPEKLANFIYAGRNGNKEAGDGWRFRGRGPQLTGRANYAEIGKLIGVDLVNDPDKAATLEMFVPIAIAFWTKNALNDLADHDDAAAITLRVNGGKHGLNERTQAARIITKALK